MGQTELPANTKRTITHQFYQVGQDVNRWLRLAASVLAHQISRRFAGHLASPGPGALQTPGADCYPRAPGFDGAGVSEGQVRQQMLSLAEPVTQEQLSATANRINKRCEG
jgi:heat-inducible transcriptional repressor